MNSEIVYWLDALNGIMKSPDLHFGVLVKITQIRARSTPTESGSAEQPRRWLLISRMQAHANVEILTRTTRGNTAEFQVRTRRSTI